MENIKENAYKVDDSIFDFVYKMAVSDATMQKAYISKKSSIENNQEVKKTVRKYIDSLFNDTVLDFYDTANEIRDYLGELAEYNTDAADDLKNVFCFGNIQKLINMSAKYMYISCYNNSELRECFRDCHCPMDSFMISIVRKEYSDFCSERRLEESLLDIPYGKGIKPGRDGSRIAWSKKDFNDTGDPRSYIVYERFQEMVKLLAKDCGLIPLEYDYVMWNKYKEIF